MKGDDTWRNITCWDNKIYSWFTELTKSWQMVWDTKIRLCYKDKSLHCWIISAVQWKPAQLPVGELQPLFKTLEDKARGVNKHVTNHHHIWIKMLGCQNGNLSDSSSDTSAASHRTNNHEGWLVNAGLNDLNLSINSDQGQDSQTLEIFETKSWKRWIEKTPQRSSK